MSGDLAPADAVVALRSFPRRFREVVAAADDDDLPAERRDEVVAHVAAAGAALASHGEAVRHALVAGPGAAPPPAPPTEPPSTAEAALDLVALEAGALADRVAHVAAETWAAVPGALAHLRDAVEEAASHLRAAGRLTSPGKG